MTLMRPPAEDSTPEQRSEPAAAAPGTPLVTAGWIVLSCFVALIVAFLIAANPVTPTNAGLAIGRSVTFTSFTLLTGACLIPTLLAGRGAALGSARVMARWFALAGSLAAGFYLSMLTVDADPSGQASIANIVRFTSKFSLGAATAAGCLFGTLYVVMDVLAAARNSAAPWRGHLGIVVAIGALAPITLSGHASHSSFSFAEVMVFAMIGHVFAAMCWVGGLVALSALAMSRPHLLATALPRFSVIAAICVAVVAATGLLDGWLILINHGQSIGAIVTTRYGVLLLAKLVLLGLIGVSATQLRYRLLPHLADVSRAHVLRWLCFEAIVMALAFGVAGVLATSTPN
ncbi:CopD family protein [Gordonia hydrophobica]|uniref:CopD family protein n=1 Tax=Gordonia hydrophobica TaxID=40516 RepID=A0ABZ2U573_9ACTN|nr:CopD family protein [Gordonia hydrophobica]MBM7368687.1 putative copper resistance protein D [Gordonia hydrophobica]